VINNQSINNLSGLSSLEARNRLIQYGDNIVEEKQPHRFIIFVKKFWSPVPWMLEITILLQLVLMKYDETIIISTLLLFNSLLSFFQEERANKVLTLLRHHLAIKARVYRDSQWQLIAAKELVPGDIVHLRMGDISPADIKLIAGNISIDQSILTGESMPIEGDAGKIAYSGAVIKRGEATGEIIATGKNTFFGKSIELVKTAKADSHIKHIIFKIIKYLVTIDILLAACVFIFAIMTKFPIMEILPFILILVVASIPVALPATFTFATALGAIQLTKLGVLVTHLTSIEEAATMDVLCIDKTGTITENKLQLAKIKAFASYTESELLYFAALASDESTQDPIDQAILSAAYARNLLGSIPERLSFIPFSPTIRRTEATYDLNNNRLCVIKGAPDIIATLSADGISISDDIAELAKNGYRIIAVAVNKNTKSETDSSLQLVGLIAFNDPPRTDSKSLLHQLKEYGLQILIVTGDNKATATSIAANVGIHAKATSAQSLQPSKKNDVLNYNVFAGMFPEDKFKLVKTLQASNHIVGMTGDGVNDAPALKQAEVGIAVESATDVAKAAASIVLTKAGLSGILSAIEVSRHIYQRMLTYILNKIIKSLEIAVFLSLGIIFTGKMIITPLLIVLLLFTNDFVTMSIATDNVPFSHKPERWRISTLMAVGGILSLLILILSFAVFFYARNALDLSLSQLQTLIFVLLVFTGQGTVYLIRERKHLWYSLPSRWLIFSSLFDIVIVTILATKGILMTAISSFLVVELLFVVIAYLCIVDFCKIRIFSYFNLR
jgi:H+-transporting ATPase